MVHPYQKVKGKGVVSRDMNLHALPWPKEQLQALPPDTKVELRVTLSYFIEPNPSARGTSSSSTTHRIACALMSNDRWTRRPRTFVARINAAASAKTMVIRSTRATPTGFWVIASATVVRCTKTSGAARSRAGEPRLHRGIPAKGWWRTRPAQERYDLPARYSLIVSIRTPETDVDLYTPIAQQVAAQVAVPIVVNT
jgi:hypothetical protein